MGWFAWSFGRSGWQAGLPLGLLAIKPHFAVGIAVFALLSRRWGVVATATAVVAATSLAATVTFGPGVWPAFLDGVRISAAYLKAGAFQEFRMASLFAALRSMGLDPDWAMIGHAAVALVALGILIAGWTQGLGAAPPARARGPELDPRQPLHP